MVHLKRRFNDEWAAYVREMANQLGLRDWTVHLMRVPSDDARAGEIKCTYGRKHACLWVNAGFGEMDPKEQRQVIIHELLHCHFAPAIQMLVDASGNVGKTWVAHLDGTMRMALEYGIDAIADEIAPNYPLPPAKKRKRKPTKRKKHADDR